MIKQFVDRSTSRRDELRMKFAKAHPKNYKAIVKAVVEVLGDKDEYDAPDPKLIHEIDDGDYQGTLVCVIGAVGYQPSIYWYVKVAYGSCSGCDTLERIKDCGDDPPTTDQVSQYMTLALHIVQGLKRMGDEDDAESEGAGDGGEVADGA